MRITGHLKEDQFLECYLAGRSGETVNPRLAEHLDSCDTCLGQYQELTTLLEEVRDTGNADADAIFGPDALARQQQQIARRLEHVHRSARVIAFPARDAGHPAPRPAYLTARWLAAAAAAGLFIGVAVGGYLRPERLQPQASATVAAPSMSVQRPSSSPAVLVNAPQPAVDEDAFLMELELALARPQPRELAAFDALTPHVRDIR
ncbi:MAG: hypothetical protein U0Q55_21680 [Vicinamibacterales bacterium]